MFATGRRDALRLLGSGLAGLAAASHAAGSSGAKASAGGGALTRRIPSSGEALPAIGLGTWQTFDVDPAERAPLEAVLAEFSTLGGTVIDSSPMYGRSEEVVGALAEKLGLRRKLFLATKVWTSGRDAGIAQMEESMRRLRADRIDLFQVHNLLDVETHLETLEQWKAEGRVRYLGVTHYHAGAHDAVARIVAARKLDFVQINYSVAEREAEQRLLPLALERGVAVIANRPFAAGGLVRRLRGKPLPSWARELDCESWPQLLLKFVISHPSITCAIPATSSAAHLRDNLQAARGRLPDEKMRARIMEAAS
jgi:diketogulonate reductase-like aldo/keto reductase